MRLGGPGDKGRDIAAYVTDPVLRDAEWDSYQCKHYDHALQPTDIYKELGKLCFYVSGDVYTQPRKYRFVAPFSVVDVDDLLRGPELLKTALISNWDKYCRTDITETTERPLEGELEEIC